MNFAIYRISLDVHEVGSQVCLNVKKGDKQRKIIANLTEEGKPYTITSECSAVFRAKKPDGTILYNNCTISENTIVYDLTTQTVSAVGEVECEMTLYGTNNAQITSPRFTMIVDDTLYSDDEVESEDEFSELTEAITEVNTLDVDVSKTGTVTTVTVTHSDGTTDTATIYDGANGAPGPAGANGVSVNSARIDVDGHLYVTLSNGTQIDAGMARGTTGAQGPKGDKGDSGATGAQGPKGDTGETGAQGPAGATGVGISDIAKTSTAGKVDTYTITLTNGTTKTFTVTNGNDGAAGADGQDGDDGISVTGATINSSGHLIITLSNSTTVDAGNAKGADGADGDDGVSVTGVTINSSGHLIVTLSDSSTIDAGEAKGPKGDTGDSGVYIGTTPPTDPSVRVWIDTSGSAGDVEMTVNKVTSISSSSTDTQYPSAKLFYDTVGNIESTLQAIRGVSV